MSRSDSEVTAAVEIRPRPESTESNRNAKNNERSREHMKMGFDQEISRVTVCLLDCRKCTGFYTDVTERYVLTCLCPCHSKEET
ncbi:MAG: hypothetical protein WBL67_14345 [Nitrososphaeraceae archaeon]